MNKFFWNLIAPILLKARWKRVDMGFFSEKSEIDLPIPVLNENNNHNYKVIIASIRSLAHSNLFEGAVGKALKENGVSVRVLRCGQFLKNCETKSHFKDNQMTCSMCHIEFDSFLRTFGLDDITYHDLISNDKENKIREFVEQADLHRIKEWLGVNLEKEWHGALQRYYLSSDMQFGNKPEIARGFLFSTIASIEVGFELHKQGFTHLFTSHGIYSTWGGVVAGFKKAGGNVSVWGRGYYKSGILSFKGESYLNGLKYFTRDRFMMEIDEDKISTIIDYLDSRWALTNNTDLVKYYDNTKNETSDISEIIPNNKKIIGFYPNIPWDGQVFVATENFKGLRNVIESLIKFTAQNENVHVIVRPHPYENPKKNQHIGERFIDLANEYELENNSSFTIIAYDSTVTSYDLAEKSSVNVLLAGTIGLEFAARGFPVIQLGENISSNKEIFFEPKNYEELHQTLNSLLDDNSVLFDKKTTTRKALEWASFFYIQAHIEDLFFFNKGTKITGVKSKSNANLELSKKYLEWILDGKGLFFKK